MKRKIAAAIFVSFAILLCGCILEPVESLYAVPKQSDDYNNLQSAIEDAMPSGANYSAPTAGENQQAVQMIDLNGDGTDEAVVYIKTSGNTPLLVYVFEKQGDSFQLKSKAEGPGSAFGYVQYVHIDDRPGYEIVLGRQISDQVSQILSVYSFIDGELLELMSVNYSEFTTVDLNSDGLQDIFLLRNDGDKGIAELYCWNGGQLLREREASLSTSATAVKRINTGDVYAEVPAVFVAQEYGENTIITDIFAFQDGVFTNITRSDETGTSVSTVRDYYVYSCDIDNDGHIELPRVIAIASIAEDENSKSQSLVQWYNLTATGEEENKKLTYYNIAAGWYLEIKEGWRASLRVTRGGQLGGTAGYQFCLYDSRSDTISELLTIASVSGENAAQLINDGGWTVLNQKGETMYAYYLGDAGVKEKLTHEQIREMFNFIYEDWITGET